jgi:hypothetical protein
MTDTAPLCGTCNKVMTYSGRISLPPHVIYRCEECRAETWEPPLHQLAPESQTKRIGPSKTGDMSEIRRIISRS